MDKKIKLLICYHKKDVLLKDDVLTPIHVGRALARQRMGEDDPQFKWLEGNMIGDDTGDNISDKNSSYNELTAVYWAWKNYEKLGNPDYIGLMHYRRHFIFRESSDVVENVRGIDENYFKRINYNADTIAHLMNDCDYVAHIGHVNEVYKHYKENHHIEDLELAVAVLKERYPQYASTADAYLKMSYVNLCNMFIMPRGMFFEYCSWLFDILGEFERRVDLSEKRLFISERLTGIFIEHQRRKGLGQKALAATFIQTPVRIPVAMPYTDPFRMAVTMASILKNAESTTYVDFHILHCGEASCDEFDDFIKRYPGHSINYVNALERLGACDATISDLKFPELYPLIVSEILREYNKLLYVDEHSLFLGDVARFFLACNNDEYAVLGLPCASGNKKFQGNVYSINSAFVRRNFMVKAIENLHNNSCADKFFLLLDKWVGYFPKWVYFTTLDNDLYDIFYSWARTQSNCSVWERSLMYFAVGTEPWDNLISVSSIFWRKLAYKVPASIAFTDLSEKSVNKLVALSKIEAKKRNKVIERIKYYLMPYKAQGVIKKTFNYLKIFGIKKTIFKIFNKLWVVPYEKK